MNRILILYPILFKSYSKFFRKIEKIISNLENVTLVCPNDYNGFIKDVSNKIQGNINISICNDWRVNDITHAIVFDDGEEFLDEVEKIKLHGIPMRYISIAITRVININDEIKYKNVKSTSSYEYIGRGSYWGNPYSMYTDGEDRDEVIRKFKYDFDYEKFPKKDKKEVYKLSGKRLGCFCKPQNCHGDIIADFLNSFDDGK